MLYPFHHRPHIHGDVLRRRGGVEPCEGKQLLGDAGEPISLVPDVVEELPCRLAVHVVGLEQGVGEQADGGQWGFELMGGAETKRRRTSSVVWRRPVSSLNSSARRLSSSPPRTLTRWLYSPSRTVWMPRRSWAIRRVRALEKTTPITSDTIQMTMEIKRRLVWIPWSSAPCSASYS